MGIISHAQKMVISKALPAWEKVITSMLTQEQLQYLKNQWFNIVSLK